MICVICVVDFFFCYPTFSAVLDHFSREKLFLSGFQVEVIVRYLLREAIAGGVWLGRDPGDLSASHSGQIILPFTAAVVCNGRDNNGVFIAAVEGPGIGAFLIADELLSKDVGPGVVEVLNDFAIRVCLDKGEVEVVFCVGRM